MKEILVHVFTIVDDFCLQFEKEWNKKSLSKKISLKCGPKCHLSTSEIMTILISFQVSESRNFKGFYSSLIQNHKREFPHLVSYSRFVTIAKSALFPLVAFFEFVKGVETGHYFVDATAIAVCKNKRISGHKVFKNLAKRGKSSMGWFFGFKLHLICNHEGAPIKFRITTGNIDDRTAAEKIMKNLTGTIVGDKGYISKALFSKMFGRGLRIVTSIRSKMKPQIVSLPDSEMISKRSLIESVFNVLKNSLHLEHSRHRSPINFIVNIVSTVSAFAIRGMSKEHFNEKCKVQEIL